MIRNCHQGSYATLPQYSLHLVVTYTTLFLLCTKPLQLRLINQLVSSLYRHFVSQKNSLYCSPLLLCELLNIIDFQLFFSALHFTSDISKRSTNACLHWVDSCLPSLIFNHTNHVIL